jgi:hypothetical protein
MIIQRNLVMKIRKMNKFKNFLILKITNYVVAQFVMLFEFPILKQNFNEL